MDSTDDAVESIGVIRGRRGVDSRSVLVVAHGRAFWHIPLSPRQERWSRLALAIAVVVAGLIVILFLQSQRGIPSDYETTNGTVLSIERVRSGEDSYDWIAAIRFSDSDHIEYTFSGQVGSLYRVRNQVQLWYDPRDPAGTAVTERDQSDSWLAWMVGIAVAAAFAVFKLIELDVRSRR